MNEEHDDRVDPNGQLAMEREQERVTAIPMSDEVRDALEAIVAAGARRDTPAVIAELVRLSAAHDVDWPIRLSTRVDLLADEERRYVMAHLRVASDSDGKPTVAFAPPPDGLQLVLKGTCPKCGAGVAVGQLVQICANGAPLAPSALAEPATPPELRSLHQQVENDCDWIKITPIDEIAQTIRAQSQS